MSWPKASGWRVKTPNLFEGAMAIVVNLDVMLARRKQKSKDLALYVGITEQNISLIRSGKVKGMRFSTLEKICAFLDCQPGDILEYQPDD